MVKQWDATIHFPMPTFRRQGIRIPVGEDPLEPALHDCRKVAPVDGRNKGQPLGILHLLPLGDDIFGPVAVDKLCDRLGILVPQPARGNPALDRASRGVEDMLLQIHLFEDFQRHAFVNIAGKILRTKDRVEPDGIQVDHFIGVTGVLEPFGELLKNGMAEGLGIGMSEHDQDFHGIIL